MGEDVAEYVDRAAARFLPGEMRGGLLEAQRLARYLWASGLVAGKSVLDAGCGVGDGSQILAGSGAAEVVGVDIAPAMVEAAQSAGEPNLRFERGDIGGLQHPSDKFEVVVCFEVIDQVEDPDAVLTELARVLTPDGILAMSWLGQEFHARLKRRWPRLRLLQQEDWIGSAVLDCPQATSGTNEPPERLRIRRTGAGRPEIEPQIALASALELPDLPAIASVTSVVELRRWLEHSDQQRGELDEQRQRIQEFETMERERKELRTRLIESEAKGERVVQLKAELERARWRHGDLQSQLDAVSQILDDVVGSPSWRLTQPLRAIKRRLRSR